jgi:tetratricopeptide (TPR) repeat protein
MKPAHANVTVGLAMIVKNEALTLPRLAASLDGQLDHWTIVDTGSTDDTVAIVNELFAGVPGEVIEDEWRGYGPSRNVALAAGRPHSDWILTLDADETLHGTVDGAVSSEFDCIEAEQHYQVLRYWLPRMVRTEVEWEWHGRAHEYLARTNGQPSTFQTTSFYVEHHSDGGNRSTKFQRELGLLQADLRDHPEDPRTIFYLARTYDDHGEYARAASWYRKRANLGGWEEETWYATWCLGRCLIASGKSDEGCGVLMSAWGARTWRAEPLWTLAEHYRTTGQWRLGYEACELARRHCAIGADTPGDGYGGDRLFVYADVYEWRIAYEQSICAYYLVERPYGSALVDELLQREDLPPEIAASVVKNRQIYDEAQ